MRRTRAVLGPAAVVLAVGAALLPASSMAAAPDGGRSVERWDATYALQPDGSAEVTVEIDFDFGNDPGHGPYWTLPIRQGYDDSHDRVYEVTDVSASSPSGAPADVHLDEEGDGLAIRVGDEAVDDVSGVQTYVLRYTVHHVMNDTSAAETGDAALAGDELYWNVIGDGWTTPIADVAVTVTGPADVLEAACWAGRVGVAEACGAATHEAGAASFAQESLSPGQPLTVAVLYPVGTFDTTPALTESNEFARAFRVTPWTVGIAGLLLVGGGLLIVRRLLPSGADHEYAGITPGLAPGLGQEAHVRRRDRGAPVAVAFAPPPGLRPGQLGTLIDEKADPRDVTATIVDLAVRGYLVIEEAGRKEYALVRLRDPDEALFPYEQMLLDGVFAGRDRVTLTELKTTFHADMAKVQAQLYRNVTDHGWFRRNPTHARGVWAGLGVGLVVAGGIGTLALAAFSLALIAVPLLVLGVIVLATVKAAPARTPEGTRVLAETRGFELYLRTAEAGQLRFEEGHDVFGRYLPFAIAFGVAEQWARKFEALAAQGVPLAEPTWYRGAAYGLFWAHAAGFGHRMNEFAGLVDAAISAPTPGSTGGSGFGGGGFAGGGGGGGGGGGW